MGFDVEVGVSAVTVFVQGLLSFFSPCVLPLVPLYVSYLAGGMQKIDENGQIRYPRKKILFHTLFFVLGISGAFLVLGFGFTALGMFLDNNRIWFARISGMIMIFMGLYQFGILGKSTILGTERRLPVRLEQWVMGPVTALILGFTFSFAWTPCVGPTLGSVLLMAGSYGSAGKAFLLIGVYTLGFVLPFLAVGIFTGTVLEFFKRHMNVVKYTVKVGAVLLVLMGIMTLTGVINDGRQETEEETYQESDSPEKRSPDFTLTDQYGISHTLSDYKGKTVFLNFWGTWCPPCRSEMPEIQKLYEDYDNNQGDLIVIGVAAPGSNGEGTVEDITAFLEENDYSFPVVMDKTGAIFYRFNIRAFPTTFMIDREGNVYGYIEGAITGDIMESIVQQTMESGR